jgi:hypothetical protein
LADSIDFHEIPHALKVIRKAVRWFAGFWILMAVVMVIMLINDILNDPDNPEIWSTFIGLIVVGFLVYLFMKIPDWFIGKYQDSIMRASIDAGKEVQRKRVETGQSTFDHIEITDKSSTKKMLEFDNYGRVIFDSTQRPIRLWFGGGFLLIGIIIGVLIFTFSNDIGWFEYFFVGGWTTFCLVAMGFVYEVVIDQAQGIAERKSGWFFLVFKRRFNLSDFSKVLVESTFYRMRHDPMRERYYSEDPKFSVDLDGNARLNLKVFSSLTDARHLGEEVSNYLKFPLEEHSEVNY